MRDPKRIKKIVKRLEKVWNKCPDLRLCQLLSNTAFMDGWTSDDWYYWEDDKLYKALNKYKKKYKRENLK